MYVILLPCPVPHFDFYSFSHLLYGYLHNYIVGKVYTLIIGKAYIFKNILHDTWTLYPVHLVPTN